MKFLIALFAPIFFLPLLNVAFAQDDKPAPAAEAPAEKAPAAKAETVTAGEFTFDLGDKWTAGKPTSRMVSGVAKHTATKSMMKFYYFGEGQGGGIKANVDRWKGQFKKLDSEKVEAKKFGDHTAHVVYCTGTYNDGPMFGPKTPKADHAMLGAICESKKGAVFLKLTAPKATVEKLRADFDALLASAYK